MSDSVNHLLINLLNRSPSTLRVLPHAPPPEGDPPPQWGWGEERVEGEGEGHRRGEQSIEHSTQHALPPLYPRPLLHPPQRTCGGNGGPTHAWVGSSEGGGPPRPPLTPSPIAAAGGELKGGAPPHPPTP